MAKAVYLIDGARTPFGSYGGSFTQVTATQLGVAAAKAALERSGVSPQQVDNVVFGNVIQSHNGAAYIARHIALDAGVPEEVPALTVNRLCGSGLQAVVTAAKDILLGDSEVALAGGAENMSQTPYLLRGARFGMRMGDGVATDMLTEVLTDCRGNIPMGITAENLAKRYNISREAQDEFALLSHQRAAAARANGRFAKEIVPVTLAGKRGETVVDADEHIRPDTTLEGLARLKPAFDREGTVTAGNASGINDGAAAVVIASEEAVQANGWKPAARIVGYGVSGVDPAYMGIGPVPAIRKALAHAGLAAEQIALWEVNEAFAAQYLSVEQELGLPRERTNVNGGAIALGHPVGASGTRVLLTLAYELRERGEQYGVASLCIGGGQGIAMVIEAV
ncbi:acetyl-CoA C-acetyltransferase [Alicyclobacillus cycloheptanicus]|uniref:acetyl-CoA C-acetyltransferase n=1 Tax=Alicyclobacillus cycloheptanicus TaxID=1457 RepID=A0ABT9XEC1_9BACL|nr:acetyl-CoA C-acetyltransferase [Alicyclobacillus cycloheptanicus]MDQ0188646.1 acetyl-CoA C-acetyltransferase [Alicyclobacillus cycloheptanicus]WDM00679.1 acetyl-CoA C-acetyltransferase [Alicyclobacillus cycloheptanicus]